MTQKRRRRIVMTGGGTAGHVMPNIALLPELRAEDYLIAYIGSEDGIEKQLIKDQHIRYYGISSGKLRRYMSLQNFTDPFKVIKGYTQAKKILKKLKPDVVFSKGGFVSVPVGVAAGRMDIPVIIHESDMTPGLANKIAMRYADKICCTFPETIKYIPEDKAYLTGTPIRSELISGNVAAAYRFTGLAHGKPVILVVGGSTGAKNLNEAVRKVLPTLLEKFQVGGIFRVMDGGILFEKFGECLSKFKVRQAVFGLNDNREAAESSECVFDGLEVRLYFVSFEGVL